MFRCIVNEGEKDEFVIGTPTRDELDVKVAKAENRGRVRTKRFFKIKETE